MEIDHLKVQVFCFATQINSALTVEKNYITRSKKKEENILEKGKLLQMVQQKEQGQGNKGTTIYIRGPCEPKDPNLGFSS